MNINNRLTHASLLAVLAITALATATGCSSPLASRRAQVIEPGELEVAFIPYVEATAIVAAPTTPGAYPFAEASARFGLVDRLDLQIKVDPTIIPEIALGYQLVGDPSKNELAFTITGGVKPSVFMFPGVGAIGLITTPMQAIVDVPIGDSAVAVAGMRVISAVLFMTGPSATGGSAFTIAPGAFGALHFDLGPFYFRPELAMNGLIPLFAASGIQATPIAPQLGTINVAASVGVGGVIDFAKKKPAEHEMDHSAPIVPSVPAPTEAPTEAPAEAPVEAPAPLVPVDPAG